MSRDVLYTLDERLRLVHLLAVWQGAAPLRSPLSFKPFGAAVKFRAGGRLVGQSDAAHHRPCVHLPIPASRAGPMGSTHALAP